MNVSTATGQAQNSRAERFCKPCGGDDVLIVRSAPNVAGAEVFEGEGVMHEGFKASGAASARPADAPGEAPSMGAYRSWKEFATAHDDVKGTSAAE